MPDPWGDGVLRRFDRAAQTYASSAGLQQRVARCLADHCRHHAIPNGLWVDLGSGTGYLAEALERQHAGQRVLRIDGSRAMLRQHPSSADTLRWDLRTPLPRFPQPPTLLASSFCLHWLPDPERILQQWLRHLAPEGWLALALPVEGCFPQWHHAAAVSGADCTALDFPCAERLCRGLAADQLRLQEQLRCTVVAPSLPALLKPLRRVGADSTHQPSLSVGAWRSLQKAWEDRGSDGQLRLTWVIQLLLIRR